VDPYLAEKLVAGKQAELRAEAIQAAVRAELSRGSGVTGQSVWVKAMRAAAILVRRRANSPPSRPVSGKLPGLASSDQTQRQH
jgi:hypothetical protein